MSKKHSPEHYVGKRAGFLYLAINPTMPGLVKAGRTQDSPDNRLKGLYATGVPEPFVCLDSKFFIDCYTAEEAVLKTLATAGKRCNNREFFRIDEKMAWTILDNHYRCQNELEESWGNFEAEAQEAFRQALVTERPELPELIVNSLSCLPYQRRCSLLLEMLATALTLGAEYYAIWLVRERGVDPEVPIALLDHDKGMDLYYFNGYENSIVLRLTKFEKYLRGIGCNLNQSNALCWVIDCLINDVNRNDQWKGKLVRFGIDLLKGGADVQRVLEVGLFAESPGKPNRSFRYDLFPRNSGKSCYDVIDMLAQRDKHFAALRDAMSEIE